MDDLTNKNEVVKVTIFGEEYPIKGYANKEHIIRVAEYVDRKMRDLAMKSRNRSSNKIAVLTALNLADELLELKDRSQTDMSKLEDRAKNILDILESSLSEADGS